MKPIQRKKAIADIPGLSRVTEKQTGALLIEILRSPTVDELEDPAVLRTWKALSVLYYREKSQRWSGLKALQAKADKLRAECSLHSFRRGIRELVDASAIICSPNPGIGERLPD